MGNGKTCPQCGDALLTREGMGGTLWMCNEHGLRDWFFDEGSVPTLRGALFGPGRLD